MTKLFDLLKEIDKRELFQETYVRLFSDESGALCFYNGETIIEWGDMNEGLNKLETLVKVTKIK